MTYKSPFPTQGSGIGLTKPDEASMIEAHKAGVQYFRRNGAMMPADFAALESLARSCGWHGEDQSAFVAGFCGAARRASED